MGDDFRSFTVYKFLISGMMFEKSRVPQQICESKFLTVFVCSILLCVSVPILYVFLVWTNIFLSFYNSFQSEIIQTFEWASRILIFGSRSTAVFKFILCVCTCKYVYIHMHGMCMCPYTLFCACARVHVCIYVYIRICGVCTCPYMLFCVWARVHVCTYVYTRMCGVCMCPYMLFRVCTCPRMHICVRTHVRCVHMFIHAVLCVCTCACMYICAHTHVWHMHVSIHATRFQLLFNFQVTRASADASGGPMRPVQVLFVGVPNWSLTMGSPVPAGGTSECTWREKATRDDGGSFCWRASALETGRNRKDERECSQC